MRHCLSVDDGLVYLDNRIVIPTSQRPNVLRSLHSALQGKVGMKARANGSIYWPEMNASIRNTRASCMFSTKIAPSQTKEPINLTKSPDWPCQQIVIDLSNVGNHGYLACADRLTDWLILYHQSHRQANASRLISICRDIFQSYGALENLTPLKPNTPVLQTMGTGKTSNTAQLSKMTRIGHLSTVCPGKKAPKKPD